MNLLQGKTALVFGVANDHSIAWGITKIFHENGAQIGLSYAGEVLEKRVRPLAESIGCKFVEACDVARDEDIREDAVVLEGEHFAGPSKADGGFVEDQQCAMAVAGLPDGLPIPLGRRIGAGAADGLGNDRSHIPLLFQDVVDVSGALEAAVMASPCGVPEAVPGICRRWPNVSPGGRGSGAGWTSWGGPGVSTGSSPVIRNRVTPGGST